MTQQEQLKLISEINEKGIELFKSKGHDYAGVDILKNFKQMHNVLQLLEVDMSKVEGVHMFYILLKVQRLCNLLFSNKVAKNESVSDTLIDLRNYTDLLNCTLQEKKISEIREPKAGDIVITEGYSLFYDGKPLTISKIIQDKYCYFNEGCAKGHNFDKDDIIKYLN